MPILRTMITVTATAAFTSAFWITVYNGQAAHDGAPAAEQVTIEQQAAAAVSHTPSGQPGPATAIAASDVTVAPTGLAIPVAGKSNRDLYDTFTAPRGGGRRVHRAIDIMAQTGTPVVAAAPGTVEKMHFSRGGGGITAYVRSEDGQWMYYYAHLDAYAPGLREGQRVARGDPIGTVGYTGNANPAGPHLHFAVYRMAPGQRWYQGTPVNPYPLLGGGRR